MSDKHAIHATLLHLDLDLDSNASQSYAYKAFLETMFSFNKDAKDTYLKNHLWFQDNADEAKTFVKKEGSAYDKRQKVISEGKTFHFESFIHNGKKNKHKLEYLLYFQFIIFFFFLDIFFLAKYLLPNISMRLEFTKEGNNRFSVSIDMILSNLIYPLQMRSFISLAIQNMINYIDFQ